MSLRRIAGECARGGPYGGCMGCLGRKQSSWLLSFIDYESIELPMGTKLGKLCAAGHRWEGLDMSLRNKSPGHCVECDRARSRSRSKENYNPEKAREWYQKKMQDPAYAEERQRRNNERWLSLTPEQREQRIEYKRQRRESLRAQGLTCRGTFPVASDGACARGDKETVELRAAIRGSGRFPSVARLVYEAQRDHWRECPEDRAAFVAQRARWQHHWRYLMEPEYRIYHRQKSKRRKALERGSIGLHVKGSQIRARFEQFGSCCAYCGATGDLHIEHLVPIAKGGTHVLGNILPACKRCNFSKRDKDAETWYRAQPWFSETRWRRIRQVLGIGRGHSAQLALL